MKKVILPLVLFVAMSGFSQSTDPSPYCNASFDDAEGFPVDDHINAVSFGGLNNASNAQFEGGHYVFYSNLPVADFQKGNTYTLKTNFKTAGLAGYGVWIDFNNNQIFENDEKVAGTEGQAALEVGMEDVLVENQVTIPASAATGNVRMRVRIVEDDMYTMNTTSILPCNASSSSEDVMDWGETEDYTINILDNSTTGLTDASSEDVFTISPNPNDGVFSILSSSEIGKVEVYSALGQLVFQSNTPKMNPSVDLCQHEKGVYFVRVTDANQKVVTKRVVIK